MRMHRDTIKLHKKESEVMLNISLELLWWEGPYIVQW